MYFNKLGKLLIIPCILCQLVTVDLLAAAESTSTELPASLHVAVASNFLNTLKSLVELYSKNTSVKIIISSASTGKLATQIRFGAPYDIFLAADKKHPQLLIKEDLALADSFYVYAQGKLLLISRKDNGHSAQEALQAGNIEQLAIANYKTAPYGLVAKNWLADAGFSAASFQLITAENINQTWQFFQNGGADAALVALSQILLVNDNKYPYWLLPVEVNQHLNQAVVILKNTSKLRIATEFITFLKSSAATNIIRNSGYNVNY